jgi:hypothetical protein
MKMTPSSKSRAPTYSSDEFLEDYKFFSSRSFLLVAATPKGAAVFTRALFSLRYRECPALGEERMNLFLKAMVAIEANHKNLADAGYLRQFPEANYSRVTHSLIRALHRLIIEQGKTEPTFEEIKEASDFFAARN